MLVSGIVWYAQSCKKETWEPSIKTGSWFYGSMPETGCVLPSAGQKGILQLQFEYSEILFVEFQVATVRQWVWLVWN